MRFSELLEYKELIDIRNNNDDSSNKLPFKKFIRPEDGFYFIYDKGILLLHSTDNFYRDLKTKKIEKIEPGLWNLFGGEVNFKDKTITISKESVKNKDRQRIIGDIQEVKKAFKELFKFGVDESFIIKGLVGFPKIKTVSDFLNMSDYYQDLIKSKNIIMYHGTSEKRLENIFKNGLIPGQTGEIYYDLVPEYSEYNVYLTPNAKIAEFYAKRQALKDDSKPVVLKINVPDPAKLISDDRFIKFDASPEEKLKLGQTKSTLSLSRDKGEFAYRGKILPSFISVYR